MKMKEAVKTYLDKTRDLPTSVILVFPLFVLYQLGLLATGGVRNGVDFVTDVLMALAGHNFWNYFLINLGILIAFGLSLIWLRKKGEFNPKLWPKVIAESTVYAFFFGAAVIGMMRGLGLDVLLASGAGAVEYGVFDSLVLSIGAGLYEELVFRLFLMGGMFYAGVKWVKWPAWLAATTAVLVSSLLFSAVHYIGSLGDPFELGSFTYRFFAGVLLAVIFYLRGFAVAVYTHAIYDVIVMVFR
ncbi:CPBP family intramembrane metalloprotease [Persicimonas caeni]|uniref:CPBP family intramembrane metalloprotease n=2 Tax=Persicimonas caeni TaxID=2292766 RepID=A0A4Y6PSB3_PERCE|nr:CPBP family intramembrane metalloprotease [Persicimonas caeni]QED32419.1 CPBP family intramembrane metalloprotease [Persicimonas caeni]